MDQIVGHATPLKVGRKAYLVSYVSISEWLLFNMMQKIDEQQALLLFIHCSLRRGDSTITLRQVRRLVKKFPKHVLNLVDLICKVSLPKLKTKQTVDSSEKESERNLKTVYRLLAKMHGWSNQVVGELSPAQVHIYLTGGTDGTGIQKMSPAEYAHFKASR